LTAITENAAASVRDEAGCLRFDVMEDAQRPTHYFYEIYRDSEAFGEYKAAPHFAVW
jgi:(4S)-4-hydroxy-5-phosphonooxypentane-2,3-dione isomerase